MSRSLRAVAAFMLVVFTVLYLCLTPLMFGESLRMDVEVLNCSDRFDIHRADLITLKVENRESRSIKPVFTVYGTMPTFWPWEKVSGPDELAPGETAIYRIEQPVLYRSLRPSDRYFVNVNPVGERVHAFSSVEEYNGEKPSIVNPELVNDTEDLPLGWGDIRRRSKDDATVERGNDSVHLVARPSSFDTAASLQQSIDRTFSLNVSARPSTILNLSRNGSFTAVEFKQDYERMAFIFSDVKERKVVEDFMYYEEAVLVPSEKGVRQSFLLNTSRFGESPARLVLSAKSMKEGNKTAEITFYRVSEARKD